MTFGIELESILEKELNNLIKLKDLSFKKTDMIIDNRIKDLEETTKTEESLINEMGLLEEERERLLNTWGVALDTHVSVIIEKIPGENKGLINIKDKMIKEIEELHLRNKLNEDLIKENLDWIDFNINLISNIHGDPVYGKKPNKPSGNSIFDKKV